MINSLEVGKVIYNTLKNDEYISNLVEDKIFPIVATEGTTFPFIVYKRNNISSNSTKDWIFSDNVEFEIVVVSENYIQGIEIANKVRNILNREKIISNNIQLDDVDLVSANEDYVNDSFIQKLIFSCTVYNK